MRVPLTRRVLLTLSLATAIMTGTVLDAQQRPARDQPVAPLVGTAVISGTVVVDDANTRPLARAQLLLVGSDTGYMKITESDEQGRFSFPALPAGRYLLGGTRIGYLDTAYGARRPGRPGTQISITEGQRIADLIFKLTLGGVVTGIITDERGQPMPRASVQLQSTTARPGTSGSGGLAMLMMLEGRGSMATTDDRGIYRLSGVAPDDYTIVVNPPPNPAGDARVLSAEDIQAGLRALREPAQPSGGQSSTPAPITTTVIANAGGRGAITDFSSNPLLQSMTPMTPMMPGAAGNGPTSGYAPVYYPGTTEASQAATITVTSGEERSSIDIRAQLVPTARIECQIVTPSGQPPTNLSVTLQQNGRPAASFMDLIRGRQFMPRPGPEGRYTFAGIPPGRYTVMARTNPAMGNPMGSLGAAVGPDSSPFPTSPASAMWATADVAINGQDVSGIVLTLQPGLTLSGRVVFHSEKPVDLKDTRVSLAALPPQMDLASLATGLGAGNATMRPDMTFTIEGLVPSKYLLGGAAVAGELAGTPDFSKLFGWTLESATIGGKDALDVPFDLQAGVDVKDVVLTFTDKKQEVFGTLQDATGRPASEYTIVLFPTDKRFWVPGSRRIVIARPATDGRFEVGGTAISLVNMGASGLPPGDYFLAAVTDLGTDEQYDVKLLEALAKASVPITLAPGERRQQDLRIAGGR